MRLRQVAQPFDNADYLFELKHDGFRAITYIQNGECKLVSRNQNALRFNSLKKILATLPVQDCIIDGEIVCLDENGVSRFNWLLSHKRDPVLYAFDLLWLDGTDLRQLPLIKRKDHLQRLVRASGCRELMYAQHVEGSGKKLFAEICGRDLEGIVAKRKLSVYKDGGVGWLKIKNKNYSQAEGRHELLNSRGKMIG